MQHFDAQKVYSLVEGEQPFADTDGTSDLAGEGASSGSSTKPSSTSKTSLTLSFRLLGGETVKNKLSISVLIILVGLASTLSACGLNLERNPDGSIRLETNITEQSLQNEIDIAIADPLITDFSTDLREGYVFVSADRKRVGSDVIDTMDFRLDLGESDGHLTAVISDVQLNDIPIDEARVAVWNQTIATRLERAGKRNPNSSLQEVLITGDAITMVWRIETAQSRGE